MSHISPEPSLAEASLSTGVPAGHHHDAAIPVGATLDHRAQDFLESEASAGTRKWPAWKSMMLVVVSGIGLWALVFTVYQAIL